MYLDQNLLSALRCLEREYPHGVPAEVLDDVEAQLAAERAHNNWRQRLRVVINECLATAREVGGLMFAERAGLFRRRDDGVPHGQ